MRKVFVLFVFAVLIAAVPAHAMTSKRKAQPEALEACDVQADIVNTCDQQGDLCTMSTAAIHVGMQEQGFTYITENEMLQGQVMQVSSLGDAMENSVIVMVSTQGALDGDCHIKINYQHFVKSVAQNDATPVVEMSGTCKETLKSVQETMKSIMPGCSMLSPEVR